MLCMLLEITTVPGLGPLPIDTSEPGAEALMRQTALRTLEAWGAVTRTDDQIVVGQELGHLIRDLAQSVLLIYVSSVSARESVAQLWGVSPIAAAAVSRITPTDYRIRRVDADMINEEVLQFIDKESRFVGADVVESPAQHVKEQEIATTLRDGRRIGVTITTRPGGAIRSNTFRFLSGEHGRWWEVEAAEAAESADRGGARATVSQIGWDGVQRVLTEAVPTGRGSLPPILAMQ
jgi:hypothetical protein